jgi:outer membrane scaffolding protein for murein synthesis (MipA/OmpV family)
MSTRLRTLSAWRAVLVLCLGARLPYGEQASAEQLPLWEAGFGVAPITFPDYRGSNQQSTYALPLPYLIYRGDRLRVDRNGPRGILFDTERLQLNLSLNASVPVESDDNDARRGMPDIDPTFEIGPVLKYHLTDEDAPLSSRLELPVRAVIATDFSSLDYVGWLVLPSLWVDAKNVAGGWNFSVGLGPILADSKYHDYFFGVDAAFATPQRPPFEAEGGYSGASILLGTSRRFNKVWFGAFLRYDNLDGVAFEDSPLFKTQHALAAGFGIAWVFAQSKTLVEAEE